MSIYLNRAIISNQILRHLFDLKKFEEKELKSKFDLKKFEFISLKKYLIWRKT